MYQNLCVRCGKDRIMVKSWEEDIGYGSPITVSEYECTNDECQKIVNKNINQQRNKAKAMADKKQKQMKLLYLKRKAKSDLKAQL